MYKKTFDPNKKVMVQTQTKGTEYFANFAEALQAYPMLDPNVNTKDFTWAMHDGEFEIFADWATDDIMSR